MTTPITTEDPLLRREWLAVGWSSTVKPGELLPVRLLGRDVVLWRDAGGAIHAWEDLCIHRGAKLSLGSVRDSCVVCPYHHWTYDASGRCVFIPSHPDQTPPVKARTNVFHAQERYGIVWVALDMPSQEVPSFPEGEDASFRKVLAGPYRFRARARASLKTFSMLLIWPSSTRDCSGTRAARGLRTTK